MLWISCLKIVANAIIQTIAGKYTLAIQTIRFVDCKGNRSEREGITP